MKKLVHPLLCALASAVLTVSLIACVPSAFSISVNYFTVVLYADVTVAVFAAVSVFVKKKSYFAFITAGLISAYVIALAVIRKSLWLSAATYTNTVITKLKIVYGWLNPVKAENGDVNVVIIAAAILFAIIITLSLIRFRRLLPVIILSAAAVMPCYFVRDTPPGMIPLGTCSVILLAFFIVRYLHRSGIGITPGILVPCLALLTALILIINAVAEPPKVLFNSESSGFKGFELDGGSTSNGTGASEKIDLCELDDLELSDESELTLNTSLYGESLYLKDTIYTDFEDNVWTQNDDGWDESFFPDDFLGLPFSYGYYDPGLRRDELRIHSLIKQDTAFVPYGIAYDPDFDNYYETEFDLSISPLTEPYDRYSFEVIPPSVIEELRINEPNEVYGYGEKSYGEFAETTYTYVPNEITDLTAKDKNLKSLKALGTIDGKADAVQNYFQELGGEYSLKDGTVPEGEDYLSWFTQKKSGWCVHYATAAALVLREMGVPARYVTGYKVDIPDNNTADNTITVTQQSRHAWAEYYNPVTGWTVIDVTPGQGSRQPGENDSEAASSAPATTVEPTTAAPSADIHDNTRPSGEAATKPDDIQEKNKDDNTILNVFLIILIVLTSLLAVTGLLLLRRMLAVKILHDKIFSKDTNAGTVSAYRRILKINKRLGGDIPKEIIAVAEKAKFSRSGVNRDERQLIADYLDYSSRKLEENSGIVKNFYYKLILCLY